jgi:hypothetical protein
MQRTVLTVRVSLAFVLGLSVVGCDHSRPFAVTEPAPLGPAAPNPPVQLTFNTGPDQEPAGTKHFVVYSRLDPARRDRDRCLAYLPPEGGTLLGTSCVGGPHPDDLQDALLQPAPAEDGRIAFVREQGTIGGQSAQRRNLRVASMTELDALQLDLNILFQHPDGRRILAIRELQWANSGRLRFVAGIDYLDTNAGFDTVFVPIALGTVDPESGAFAVLTETDDAYTHAQAPDGGVWFLRTGDVRQLLYLDPANGAVDVVGTFDVDVSVIGTVDNVPVAAGIVDVAGSVGTIVQWLDPATGHVTGQLEAVGVVRGITGLPDSRRFVLDLETDSSRDLWLYEMP